jgi:hypothetical protein
VKRGLDIKERLRHEKPVGMKKMSTDEGEMFMLDNWIFASSQSKRSEYEDFGNGTYQVQPPIRPNAGDEWFERMRIRDVLLKRQFKCPDGTLSCSSIGAPDVCCGGSSTCVKVQGSSIGDVGCCPNGQSCSGTISCNESAGYTACPNSSNGGCCLPGFQCSGIGCKSGHSKKIQHRTNSPQASLLGHPLHTSSHPQLLSLPRRLQLPLIQHLSRALQR